VFLLCVSAWADFLPEDNSEDFGLDYGESIAGVPANPPKIDGNLDDWKYAVWVSLNSEDELLRGLGAWEGEDDLSVTWSTMYDDKNFYFAAAVKDDMHTPAANAAQPWLGDCIFLYIDWDNAKAIVSSKPNFARINDKPVIGDFSGNNPNIVESEIAVVPNAALGEGGMIYEVAMPFNALTKVEIAEGSEIGFTPGYEEGTDNMEGKKDKVFMDWGGVNPDTAANLGKLIFGGPLAVSYADKLATTWGKVRK
jgi:hypothetical protein